MGRVGSEQDEVSRDLLKIGLPFEAVGERCRLRMQLRKLMSQLLCELKRINYAGRTGASVPTSSLAATARSLS